MSSGPKPDFKVAIVGSRRRNTLRDRKIVFDLVDRLVKENPDRNVVIVSGGCRSGADAFAEEAADLGHIDKQIFPVPKFPPIESRWEFRKRAYARNKLVAEACDVIYALVYPDRKGGTENTIEHAEKLDKKIFLVNIFGKIVPM